MSRILRKAANVLLTLFGLIIVPVWAHRAYVSATKFAPQAVLDYLLGLFISISVIGTIIVVTAVLRATVRDIRK